MHETNFETAYETWRVENDNRATAERPAFNIFTAATCPDMPAFVMPTTPSKET